MRAERTGTSVKDWLKKYDVLTKTLSVLIAVVLWVYVVSVSNPVSDVDIKDISPVFSGSDELMASKNLAVVGDYSVDIEVTAKRHDILNLNKSDITVEVDVSEISSPGTYEMPYTVTMPSNLYTVGKKSPEKLLIKFDEEDASSVPIKLATDELAAKGYVVDKTNTSISPKELKITGLQEEISKIAYAQISISQTDVKSSISGKMSYDFYDSEGKIVKLSSIEADYDVVDVYIPILKTKEVPLSLEIQGNDNLKKYVNYTIEPASIIIAGEENALEQIPSLVAGSVKLSEIAGSGVKSFTITPPDGILNMSGVNSVSAKIELEGLSKKTIRTSLIEIVNTFNLPSGYKVAPVTTSIDVGILGTDEALKKVTSGNVRAVADLEYIVLSRGTHPVDVSIVVDGVSDAVVMNTEAGYTIYIEVK